MKRLRSSSQTFDQECRCIMHDFWSAESGDNTLSVFAQNIVKSKFKKGVIEKMREKELLGTRTNRLCINCYKRFLLESEPDVSTAQERTSKIQKCENINNDAENDGKKENIKQSLLEFINMVENNDSGELLNPTLKVYWEKLM